MAAIARDVIEDLREKIRRIEGRTPPRPSFVASGWDRIDAMLPGGGFPRGALSELSGGCASGKTAIALSTFARAMGDDGLAAFVDARHELYPPAAMALGVDLERMLVVRPMAPTAVEATRVALWAADCVLASGAFEAVAIDVPLESIRGHGVAEAMLRRLRSAADKGGAVALWLGAPGGVRVPSAVRLELTSGADGWLVRRTHAHGLHDSNAVVPAFATVHHAA